LGGPVEDKRRREKPERGGKEGGFERKEIKVSGRTPFDWA